MTIVETATLDRLERLLDRYEALRRAGGPEAGLLAALDAYSNPGNVAAGELIESAWGNAVASHVVKIFPSTAARDTASPPNGALAVTTDTNSLWHKWGGATGWRPPVGTVWASQSIALTNVATTVTGGSIVGNFGPPGNMFNFPTRAVVTANLYFGSATAQADAAAQIWEHAGNTKLAETDSIRQPVAGYKTVAPVTVSWAIPAGNRADGSVRINVVVVGGTCYTAGTASVFYIAT